MLVKIDRRNLVAVVNAILYAVEYDSTLLDAALGCAWNTKPDRHAIKWCNRRIAKNLRLVKLLRAALNNRSSRKQQLTRQVRCKA
jgi:hypothetical protein